MSKQDNKTENLKTRPPIVVVLGHVDHGKSTLIEKIKDIKITEKEAGGITQHIGAYQVEQDNKLITVIDTPGHEAFSQMRSRGAEVADIAILIIAAEEGIKPQTKEVISHIKKYKMPVVVAFNKIDKPQANAAKVAGQLTEQGIVVESQGGEVPAVNISAKLGQGIDELLEVLLLVAEMEDLKADPKKPGQGVVVESYLDSERGPTTTFLVREGSLNQGNSVVCGDSYGKVRVLEDFQGSSISKALPSTPALVVGLNEVPVVGERFEVVSSEKEAKEKAKEAVTRKIKKTEQKKKKTIKSTDEQGEQQEEETEEQEQKMLNLILKTDVKGSLEAIEETLGNIDQEEVKLNILKSEVGNISESDIKQAYSSDAVIIGFRIKVPGLISKLANRKKIKIKTFEVIYELIEEVKKELAKLLKPEIVKKKLGKLKVIAVFKKEKTKMIIGGKVISGKVVNGAKVDVVRNKQRIASGRISQLQHNKKAVPEVSKGKEAGIMFEGEPVIEDGDVLEIYQQEKIRKEL